MINYNTNIERVEYLDMGDPKNSWYLNAERFDPNFPLAMTYVTSNFTYLISYLERNSSNVEAQKLEGFICDVNGTLNNMYSVLNLIVEYFRKNEKLSFILIEGSFPNPFFPLSTSNVYLEDYFLPDSPLTYINGPYCYYNADSLIRTELPAYCCCIPNIYFMVRNWNKIGNSYYGTLLICAELEPEELRRKYFMSEQNLDHKFVMSQFTVTKDWDLTKKVFILYA